MIRRLVELALCCGAGAAWGVVQGRPIAAALGAAAGAWGWALADGERARRVLRWLASGQVDGAPRVGSLWAEVVERAYKALRREVKRAQDSDDRLQEFLAAIQASPNGVVLLDAQWRIEWCNLTAATHLGIDAKRDVQQFIRNLVRDPAFITYLTLGDFSGPAEVSGRDYTQDPPQRISIQIHPYAQGRRLLLTRDVTALRLAETMRRDFVANVSHEIRTPLTVLSGFVETLQTLPLDEADRQRYLALMAQQAQRMQTLVSDLLTLSRLEGSPTPGLQEGFAAAELLDEVLADARALSEVMPDVAHEIVGQPGPPLQVIGQRGEWLSALSNLLSNAVRYTPSGGRIQAGWRTGANGSAEWFVNDTGPGIAPEHIPRLTERFYRVDRSRSRETGGTGLGLAIVKHVLQRHGGEVRIDSKLGHGSSFVLVVPSQRAHWG